MAQAAEHSLASDWRGARERLSVEKQRAVEETLEHMADLEIMLEQDGGDYETICRDMRNLAALLRSVKSEL